MDEKLVWSKQTWRLATEPGNNTKRGNAQFSFKLADAKEIKVKIFI